jgi:hypothetical protein
MCVREWKYSSIILELDISWTLYSKGQSPLQRLDRKSQSPPISTPPPY